MTTTLVQRALISVTLATTSLFALATPVDASPEHVPIAPLFGPEAGFAKARLGPLEGRRPITVGLAPEFWGDPQSVQDRIDWLDPVLDAWNRAAGWAMLVQVTDDSIADITFRTNAETVCPPGSAACAWMDEWDTGYFSDAHVEFWPWYPTADVAAHEIGHGLGLICEGVEPLDPDYQGVMIHYRQWGATPDNVFDRASLFAAGYRVEAP